MLAVLSPIIVGLMLGVEALGGFLAGGILSGQLLAVFMSNAGSAWDNAKKLIEDGKYGGKGSIAHKAAVVGDTIGDPLKDRAGPAMNPMIKVMNLVGLLAAPIIIKFSQPSPGVIVTVVVGIAAIATVIWYSKRAGSDDYDLIEEEMLEVETYHGRPVMARQEEKVPTS